MTGSSRIVDHTTFSELQWRRDPFYPQSSILPPGFASQSHLLGDEFVEVLKDVYALQCLRDFGVFERDDVIAMTNVDNLQASIQSRLVSLSTHSSISECCQLAVYLCSVMLRCKVWPGSTTPVSHPHGLFSLCSLSLSSSYADFGSPSPTFHYRFYANYK